MSDPLAFLAHARAQFLSEDVEEQLTARSGDGYRPLVDILHRAKDAAAAAMAALVSIDPEEPKEIRNLQNEVRRFDDLVRFIREMLAEGYDRMAIPDEDRRSLEDLIFAPIRDATAEQAIELQRLGIFKEYE